MNLRGWRCPASACATFNSLHLYCHVWGEPGADHTITYHWSEWSGSMLALFLCWRLLSLLVWFGFGGYWCSLASWGNSRITACLGCCPRRILRKVRKGTANSGALKIDVRWNVYARGDHSLVYLGAVAARRSVRIWAKRSTSAGEAKFARTLNDNVSITHDPLSRWIALILKDAWICSWV